MWTASVVNGCSMQMAICSEIHGWDANASEILRWLEASMKQIPAEQWATAQIETAADYDEPCLTLTYTRPLSPEEFQAARNSQRQAEQRSQELAQLAALQAKYGNSPIVDM